MRQKQSIFSLFLLSPSSWRAWIEIRIMSGARGEDFVALLVEGVDRNIMFAIVHCPVCVALLVEGVDRNVTFTVKNVPGPGRPPRGGRG